MMTALPEPPATGQMINTNVNKHYPTSKYLKHYCQPRDLCLVGDDPIQVKRMSGKSLSCLTGQHLVNVALPLVHQGHHGVGGGAHVHVGGGVTKCSEILIVLF